MMSVRRWLDLFVVSAIGVLVGLTFGLPLSSMAEFCVAPLKDGGLASTTTAYSVVTLCFAVGQAIGAYLIGVVQSRLMALNPNRTHHATFAASLAVVFMGALTYWFGNNVEWIGAARFLQGAGSGMLNTLARTFINRSTVKAYVTVVTAATACFVSLFMGIGPAISSTFASVTPLQLAAGVRVDVFRLPAIFLAVATVAVALCLPLMTDQINVHRAQAPAQPQVAINADDESRPLLAPTVVAPTIPPVVVLRASASWWRMIWSPLASMLAIFTVVSLVFSSYESAAAPLLATKYGTTIAELGPVFLWSSLTASVVFVVASFLMRPRKATGKPTVTANAILLIILILSIIALFVLADYGSIVEPTRAHVLRCAMQTNQTQCEGFASECVWNAIDPRLCRARASLDWISIVAFAMIFVSFVVGRVISSGQFMSMLHSESSARAASLLLIVASVARMIGPVAFVALLENDTAFPSLIPFSVCGALMLVVTVHFLIAHKIDVTPSSI